MVRAAATLWQRLTGRGAAAAPPQTMRGRRAEFLRASYDAASIGGPNADHWKNADAKSADAAASEPTRKMIRERARYEVGSNSYAKGIVLTLANDTIGTGPRLQLQTGDPDVDAKIQRQFAEWSRAVGLAEKLRTMRVTKCVDGEAFAQFTTNPRLRTPVKLDLLLSEADHFTTPLDAMFKRNFRDGIEFDRWDNPVAYHRLRFHPGADLVGLNPLDTERLPADQVIHLFRVDRPGQHRGVSELATSLPLFAQLRRYTLSVLGASETAAKIGGIMKTNSPDVELDGNLPDDATTAAMDTFDLPWNEILALAHGWDFAQLKAEQPVNTYGMFKQEILNEIARCILMPYNVAAGNSSAYNFASGRLDKAGWHLAIDVERSYFACRAMDPVLEKYSDEANVIPGFLPQKMQLHRLPHTWHWDGHPEGDPQKEAKAREINLATGYTHRGRLAAEQGLDVNEEDAKAAESFGISVEAYRELLRNKTFAVAAGGGQEEEDDDENSSAKEKSEAGV